MSLFPGVRVSPRKGEAERPVVGGEVLNHATDILVYSYLPSVPGTGRPWYRQPVTFSWSLLKG